MTRTQKKILENFIEQEILANPNGIDTRILMSIVYNKVVAIIPCVNIHHISGMLGWVYRSKNHVMLIRSNGYSVIA